VKNIILYLILVLFVYNAEAATTFKSHGKTYKIICDTTQVYKYKKYKRQVAKGPARKGTTATRQSNTPVSTTIIVRDTIIKQTIIKEPTTVFASSSMPIPIECTSVKVGIFGQVESNDYPNTVGGSLELEKGSWSTRLGLGGNNITELNLDVLYHTPNYIYLGGGVLGEWSKIEDTLYLTTTIYSNGEKEEKKEHSKKKKGKKHSKRNSKRSHDDGEDKEIISVTTTIIGKTTSSQFNLSPSLTLGAETKTSPSLYVEGRIIFADKARGVARVGMGYKF